MFCDALILYEGGVLPSGPGNLNELSSSVALEKHVVLAARLLSSNTRHAHLRSLRGQFWAAVAPCLGNREEGTVWLSPRCPRDRSIRW